jgi:hypothetical protein
MPDNEGRILMQTDHLQGRFKAGMGQRLISIPTGATLSP